MKIAGSLPCNEPSSNELDGDIDDSTNTFDDMDYSELNPTSCNQNNSILQQRTKGSKTIKPNDTNEDSIELVAKGTANDVYQAKVIVFSVVIISTIGAILIYFYTRNAEYVVFHNQYKDDSEKVRVLFT